MPEEALRTRLNREKETAQRALLADMGVTDPTEVKTKLARLQELEKQQEEASRAQMTEVQRLTADVQRLEQEKAMLQGQLDAARRDHQYEKQDQVITGIASRYVIAKAAPLARVMFGQYIKTLSAKEQEALTDRDAQKWFQAYAKENPEFALTPGTAAATEAARAAAAAKKPPTTRLLNNGLPARRTTPANGSAGAAGGAAPSIARGELPDGKTIRPGPKQADRNAVKAEFKKLGINYTG